MSAVLKQSVQAFQRGNIEACKRYLIQYWQTRPKDDVTNKPYDAIANAVLTLVNSGMHIAHDINTPPAEKCDDC